ncbi:type VII secretion protein EccE [Millisia brevis]|uniref:type VII secretion protein EccE n=1 Tax=Millisia brevis TaxID=264148 RepID=UPI00082DE027|nr:type VII secretion protein EccE [Millisia brevis]
MTDPDDTAATTPRPGPLRTGPTVTAVLLGSAVAVGIPFTGAAPVWAAVGGAVVAAATASPVRGRSLLERIGGRLRRTGAQPQVDTFAWTTPDGGVIGLHRHRDLLTAVVEILPRSGGFTTVATGRCEPDRAIPLATLARSLTGVDVELDGIDVICHGRRSMSSGTAGEVYRRLIGDLPIAAERSTWVVLTMSVPRNRRAVDRRGGRGGGAARALSVTAARMVTALSGDGLRARVLTAAELDSVSRQIVTTDADPEVPDEARGRALASATIDSSTLNAVWGLPEDSITTTIRLRPHRDRDRVLVAAGYLARGRQPDGATHPARSLPVPRGVAILSHLPATATDHDRFAPFGELPVAELGRIVVPAGAGGQLVGSDAAGAGVTARLFGRGVARTYVAGELFVALQLALRAIAIGGRLLVITDRPSAWQPLARAVPDDQLTVEAAQTRPEGGLTRFDAVLLDGPYADPPEAAGTLIHVADDAAFWPVEDPDVTIVQPAPGDDRVVLTAGPRAVRLTLVTIAAEAEITGGLGARRG